MPSEAMPTAELATSIASRESYSVFDEANESAETILQYSKSSQRPCASSKDDKAGCAATPYGVLRLAKTNKA
jgi:hypothetical protein